ncbi:MAG: hypothetical protein IPN53_25170 [Comamonadaceae bacterium]|nr:hypothetical protein [Comamonadaceae bacterium]
MNDEIKLDESLDHDVVCVLLQCHRDRLGDGVFMPGATRAALNELATHIARRLGPLIGGRYVPKRRSDKDERDKEVWDASDRKYNTIQIMKMFGISRRMVYSILARKPRK